MVTRVMIVEDNSVNQKVLTRHLTSAGFIISGIAENGKVALELIEKSDIQPPDVILMDIEMPVMNGLEATCKIREREKSLNISPIPIVGLSANAAVASVKEAFSAGMNDYITKPYQKTQLCEKILQVCTIRK